MLAAQVTNFLGLQEERVGIREMELCTGTPLIDQDDASILVCIKEVARMELLQGSVRKPGNDLTDRGVGVNVEMDDIFRHPPQRRQLNGNPISRLLGASELNVKRTSRLSRVRP